MQVDRIKGCHTSPLCTAPSLVHWYFGTQAKSRISLGLMLNAIYLSFIFIIFSLTSRLPYYDDQCLPLNQQMREHV